MINLIPTEEQKNNTKGFYVRLLTVFLFLLSICICIAIVVMIPIYFISSAKEKSILNKLEVQKNEVMPQLDQDTIALIKEVDNKLSIVESSIKDKVLISEKIINQIISDKMPDIKITRISFEKDVLLGNKVSIYGTAPSRERLLLFRQALEENHAFSKVDLPVSNFIKGSDIQFYLSLVSS